MKLLYFHQHFTTPLGNGGTRSYEFSKYLISRGIKVTIVCGNYQNGNSGLKNNYKNGYREGLVEGINIIEFDLPYSNKDSLFLRSLRFLAYSIKSLILVFKLQYDVIFCTSTPLTAAIPGIFAKIFRKKPFIFEVRDLWPELPVAMGVITNPIMISLLAFLEKTAYFRSDSLIGLSPGIVSGIKKKCNEDKPIRMIPNGCDTDLFQGIEIEEEWKHKDISDADFVAVYSGTHGKANGLKILVEAAKVLKDKSEENIKIILIGEGSEKEELIASATTKGLTNIIFLDPLGKVHLNKIFSRADIGLQILANVKEFYYGTSPNKFFDYLAGDLPVLTNYPGWIADIIVENNIGYVSEPDNALSLASKLQEARQHMDKNLPKENINKLASIKFNRKLLSKEFFELVQETYENSG